MRAIMICGLGLILAACSGPDAETGSDMDTAGHGMDVGFSGESGPVAEQETAIDVRASWMRPHPGGRDVTAAYVVVQLSEGTEDLLTGARIEGAERVELHGHFIGEGGVMQMREIGPQLLTNAGPMVFTPGGRHLMVFGLATVVEGDSVEGVLEFQNAGEVPVTFAVRSMPPGQVTEY
ncbi:copper chaperone PCu(A)C [Hyphobacterium sp.]|uniref:copper chaperone PCu(A)C n=1 Tax=Hyphobacterium sp. TaxID=2004662 RepID=UPI003BA928F3